LPIDVVFFDAGNTLLYADPPVGEVYAAALRDAGVEADGREVQRQFLRAWERMNSKREPGRPEHGWNKEYARDWWRHVVQETTAPFGSPDDFEGMFLQLWDHFARGEAWDVFDDVLPAFARLRDAGKSIGLISNWDTRLPGILDELGLAGQFDWVVVSGVVGAEKPSRTIFERALAECGAAPERALHVGDSYHDDVRGALAAGLNAAWLVREPTGHHEADGFMVLRSLAELPPAVI